MECTCEKRWIFLTFTCLTFFSSEMVYEQASILVGRLCGTAEACITGQDPSCLSFSASQFNGLYVAHFWAGGLAALFTGFFIGRFGVRVTGFVSCGFLLVGMCFFTVGPYAETSNNAFAVMLTGRIIFSIGYFSNIVLSQQVNSHWFIGKELAMAFTLYTISSRLGSLTAFAIVGSIVEQVGLQSALWSTFGVGLIAPIATVIAGWIYGTYASLSIDASIISHDKQGKFDLSKMAYLGKEYWVIACIIFFYFSVLFTFLAEYPKFLTEFHGYSESKAGLLTGAVPDITMLSPLVAFFIDRYGGRAILNCLGTGIVFLGCLLITIVLDSNGIAITVAILLAISFAIMTANVWSCIPVVTLPYVVGVAIGVATGVQALAAGLMLLVSGFVLDDANHSESQKWTFFFILLMLFAGMSWILSWLSIYYDTKNFLRPLFVKHSLPSLTAGADDPDEATRLVSCTRQSIF